MKKSILCFGLLAVASLCLTACDNSKDYTMSFEEAVNVANHSALQDIISQNDNFEQNVVVAGNYDVDWNKVDANIASISKKNSVNNQSESSITFWVNITSEWETLKVDWALDTKVIDDAIYLNLKSLNLTWSENVSMVTMMVEWFKNQWFVIPVTGLNNMSSDYISVLKDSKNLNEKAKEIIVNEGSAVYSGKFTQFNWYNAWKFSLDNEKLNELIEEYYSTINYSEEYMDDISMDDIPELNIQNFEWYLVITWKDKVTTVIENMDIVEDEATVTVNGFWGENYEINVLSDWESVLSFIATKKRSDYQISLNINESAKLEWTITPKTSKSSIDVKFNAVLNVTEWEDNVSIPLKGTRTYKAISDFTVTVPEDAQDLTELLWSYLWASLWWDDYDYDYDYEYDSDYAYDEDYDYSYDYNYDEVDDSLEVEVE